MKKTLLYCVMGALLISATYATAGTWSWHSDCVSSCDNGTGDILEMLKSFFSA